MVQAREKEPQRRFQNADAMRSALARAQAPARTGPGPHGSRMVPVDIGGGSGNPGGNSGGSGGNSDGGSGGGDSGALTPAAEAATLAVEGQSGAAGG